MERRGKRKRTFFFFIYGVITCKRGCEQLLAGGGGESVAAHESSGTHGFLGFCQRRGEEELRGGSGRMSRRGGGKKEMSGGEKRMRDERLDESGRFREERS